jgi:hypothetical protein
MIIVISFGAIITFIAYFIGFIFIVYIIDKIIDSLNKFLTILNENIPQVNNITIQIFILILLGVIIISISKNDYKQHKNKNNESVYRKDWQKLLDIVNVIMIYPIFKFYEKVNSIGNAQKTYMICYAVLFLTVFIFSHYYIYINKENSKIEMICSIFYKMFTVIASIFLFILLTAIYSFFIYLHDFTNHKNIFILIIYYVLLIFSIIIFSYIFYQKNTEDYSIKTIVYDYFILIIFSILLGFSSFINLFIKKCSIYSIHSIILIDIALLVLFTTVLLPVRIKKSKRIIK